MTVSGRTRNAPVVTSNRPKAFMPFSTSQLPLPVIVCSGSPPALRLIAAAGPRVLNRPLCSTVGVSSRTCALSAEIVPLLTMRSVAMSFAKTLSPWIVPSLTIFVALNRYVAGRRVVRVSPALALHGDGLAER
jgi:hypothetical protein